ncbi:MAG: HAD-IIB family hydrolase [Polyangiaceae bacterium]
MQPIEHLPAAEAQGLEGLLFDLDDTLLDHGRLTEAAYSSLFRLRESGLRLVAVTGRPSGWGEMLVRQWPIDGAVTENGAIALHVPAGGGVSRLDPLGESERRIRRMHVAEVVARMRERFPELRPADDVGARISDFTFDIGERQRVAPEVRQAAEAFAHELGARTQASSVHLHVTFDADDKATGAVRFLRMAFGLDATLARFRFAFIGDSENDAACFAGFRTTIGVRNFSGRPSVTPRFLTAAARGAGFAEAAGRLVALRTG